MYTADIVERGKSISKKIEMNNPHRLKERARMKGYAVTGWGGNAETERQEGPSSYNCTTSKYVRIR